MAQLNVRLSDDFYEAVQSIVEKKLKTGMSNFVRDIFRDTLLIYGDTDCKARVFDSIGPKYEVEGNPNLILYLASEWLITHRIERPELVKASDHKIDLLINTDKTPKHKSDWPIKFDRTSDQEIPWQDIAQYLNNRIIEELWRYLVESVGKDNALSRLEELLGQEIKRPQLMK
jgi:hypothetical protein